MPSSTRLDKETEALLKRAAECSGETKSHLVRESIREYCARIVATKQRTPWEIYLSVRKSDKGSGHGSRVKDGKKIMTANLEEKRRKWSL